MTQLLAASPDPSTETGTAPPSRSPDRGRTRPVVAGLLLASVALAFADASVVALALPDLYAEFETTITSVSWVLTIYALAVAATGLAGLAWVRRADPSIVTAVGAALFAAASLVAGIAPSLAVLLVARAVQGVGGAALVMGALAVLGPLAGGRGRAVHWWAVAGTLGAVLGPALGGAVTQVLDWRAVFWVQAPVALGAVVAAWLSDPAGSSDPPEPPRRGVGSLTADVGLAFVFGALVGALFLGVILLVVVWGLEPIVGAAVVTALPVGTLAARPLVGRLGSSPTGLAGGTLLAGGLATLAVVPGLAPRWAAAALALCGLGFGLLTAVLGPLAVPDGAGPRAATLSSTARHLGLVLGLVLIAPVLSADVTEAAEAAPLPATATLLDAPVGAITKVQIALDIRDELADASEAEVPDLAPVFERNGAGDDVDVAALGADLETGVREVLTRSFRDAFAVAAGLALVAALFALAALARASSFPGASVPGGRAALPLVALLVAASVAVPVGAWFGGGDTAGAVEIADPCTAPPDPFSGSGFDATAQRLVLSGLNGAACELGTSREALVLSLEPRSGIEGPDWSSDTVERAVRSGVDRAIADADERDSLPGWMATVLRELVERVPVSWFLDRLGVA